MKLRLLHSRSERVSHRPAITDERHLGALMASIDEYDGWPTLRAAIRFLALTSIEPCRKVREDGGCGGGPGRLNTPCLDHSESAYRES